LPLNTLDQPQTTRAAPASWSANLVRQRLVEAYSIERRLPGDNRRRSLASSWPAEVLHPFTDVVHWDDARQRVWDSWANARGASAVEVSRMEAAQAWLERLQGDERRYLQAWAFASARGLSVRRMIEKRGIKRTTFYRIVEKAAARIAANLNAASVEVRP
jgi:hypothetical protein